VWRRTWTDRLSSRNQALTFLAELLIEYRVVLMMNDGMSAFVESLLGV
jgi:uncharacterized protein involved in response to NO